MHLIVHRGSHEIGGSCIEIASGRIRIICDAGLPLKPPELETSQRPNVAGLWRDTDGPSVDALFLSHAHADHYGLLWAARDEVPVYLSRGTSKMLDASWRFAGQQRLLPFRQRTLGGVPTKIGHIRVTAFPVDHSVYDAQAFLVEAEGKRVLYTGDLRFHGRKPGMGIALARAAQGVDALVVEGTRMGARSEEPNLSESELEEQLKAEINAARGIVLAMYSPLNLDRFVSFFRAAVKAGRTMVVDPYQAFVLHVIALRTLPRPTAGGRLRLAIPRDFERKRAWLARQPWFQAAKAGVISGEEIAAAPYRFVALFRESLRNSLFPDGLPAAPTCIFSYWPGYLKEPRLTELRREIEQMDGRFVARHASGHAHWRDLTTFVTKVRPKLLVPVHTESPEAWHEHWPHVHVAHDGVSLEV